jgi:hypothetical protein
MISMNKELYRKIWSLHDIKSNNCRKSNYTRGNSPKAKLRPGDLLIVYFFSETTQEIIGSKAIIVVKVFDEAHYLFFHKDNKCRLSINSIIDYKSRRFITGFYGIRAIIPSFYHDFISPFYRGNISLLIEHIRAPKQPELSPEV